MLSSRRRNSRRRGLVVLLFGLSLALLLVFYVTLFRLHLSLSGPFASLHGDTVPVGSAGFAIFTVLSSQQQQPTAGLPSRGMLLNALRSWARLRPSLPVLVLASAGLNLTRARGVDVRGLGVSVRYLPILPPLGSGGGTQRAYGLASLLHRVLSVSGSVGFLVWVNPRVVVLPPFVEALGTC
eukprot:RCo002691